MFIAVGSLSYAASNFWVIKHELFDYDVVEQVIMELGDFNIITVMLYTYMVHNSYDHF